MNGNGYDPQDRLTDALDRIGSDLESVERIARVIAVLLGLLLLSDVIEGLINHA